MWIDRSPVCFVFFIYWDSWNLCSIYTSEYIERVCRECFYSPSFCFFWDVENFYHWAFIVFMGWKKLREQSFCYFLLYEKVRGIIIEPWVKYISKPPAGWCPSIYFRVPLYISCCCFVCLCFLQVAHFIELDFGYWYSKSKQTNTSAIYSSIWNQCSTQPRTGGQPGDL